MELWLRHRTGTSLEFDESRIITSPREWLEAIDDKELISSILWPTEPRFGLTLTHTNRHHPHEIDYVNDRARNTAYRLACERIAAQLDRKYAGKSCLVYAPLRGALPIWRGIRQYLNRAACQVYYPVTSSFVSFPKRFGIMGKRNRPASGRYNNRFELARIRPFVKNYDHLIYVDEIVSGGMMLGHLKDMFRVGLEEDIPITPVGLADANGARSERVRAIIGEAVDQGRLHDFIWEGCPNLITEDQKFLLGVHYVDYDLGPHAVPLFNEDASYFEEKLQFDSEVFHKYLDAFQGVAPDER